MLKKLNHIAIAVDNLKESIKHYKACFNPEISDILDLPEHGVKTAFIKIPNTNIELLEPLGKKSPIKKFLDKFPDGGVHHLCYEVNDIEIAIKYLEKKGCNILGGGIPRLGAHNKPVIFIHPKEFNGTLIELEQA